MLSSGLLPHLLVKDFPDMHHPQQPLNFEFGAGPPAAAIWELSSSAEFASRFNYGPRDFEGTMVVASAGAVGGVQGGLNLGGAESALILYGNGSLPEVVIDTTGTSPEEAANAIILHLEHLGFIGARTRNGANSS